ncbi:hypothetical protein OSH10_16700 [Kaistia defluvii]|uniref:hypothetical protein n=1 Tax=Kaistia defluvii TaxID=410841 RepID=UPI0022585AB4|nr:hypothetical protein [Kaistia defluvii]MCX5520082.1 hypothetical protein [Kaistia defluvii]
MNGNPATAFRFAVLAALGLMLASDALGGPVRYALAPIGLVGLSYAPFLIAAVLILVYGLAALATLRPDPFAIAIFLPALLWLPYALLLGLPKAQVAFGVYTWVPFFLGMVAVAAGARMAALRWIAGVWAVAVIGVFANAMMPFPWVGESYEILGVQAEFAREWQAFGIERLPGFSRASFTAANQITIGGALLLAGEMRRTAKLAVWLLSILAIALTTSKAPLVAILVAPFCLALYDRLPAIRCFRFSQWLLGGLFACAIGLPLAALVGFRFGETGNLTFLSLGSVGVRMDEMWPRAYALLDPLWPRLALGVGFGGVGAGQAYFDAARFSPGDNLFVFLFVTFGFGSLLFAAPFWRGNRWLFQAAPPAHRQLFLVAILVLVLGTMANIVESVIPGFLLGMLAGKALDPRAAAFEGPPAIRSGRQLRLDPVRF